MEAKNFLKKEKGNMYASRYNTELVYYESDVLEMIEAALKAKGED